MRARSVCRIERRRLRFGLCVWLVWEVVSGSAEEAARSSIVSICCIQLLVFLLLCFSSV